MPAPPPLNQFLLDLLGAYDEGCICPAEILACAAVLARKLYNLDKSSATYIINLMQTIKRKRTLTDGEKGLLKDVALDSELNYERAAAYALLDDANMAKHCLSRCTESERIQIESYPISIFFENVHD